MRVHLEKNVTGVDHERKSDWVKVHLEKNGEGVRVHHEKERWGDSLP